ncbi:hypothetical protein PG996_008619 [Apiospora saccharicola]|uniref:Cellobiose dehydrogenase cytochrome domain-containing protein n=1 Tax=Apiospora saccharicola TaxID=335842 RepID=A0ABR1UZ34_9PEZI
MKWLASLAYIGFSASFVAAHPISREVDDSAAVEVYQLGAVVGGVDDRILNFNGFTVGIFTGREPGPIYVTALPSSHNASLFSLHLWPADRHEDHVLGLQPSYAKQESPGMITRIAKPPPTTVPGSGEGAKAAIWNTWTMVDGNLDVYPPPQNWVAVTYPNGGSGSFNLLAMIPGWAAIEPFNAQLTYTKVATATIQT